VIPLGLLASTLTATLADVHVDYVQLTDVAGCVTDTVLADVDGDGRRDLVVATGTCEHAPRAPRVLRVHLRDAGTGAFSSRPRRELPLVRDVVAFAVADVHPRAGRELVLFSPSRAVAVHWPDDANEPSYTSLFETRFLWQPADPDEAFAWQDGVHDWNGDGLDDLWIPEPGGYRMAVQRRADEGRHFECAYLELPPVPVGADERNAIRFAGRRREGTLSVTSSSRADRAWARVADAVGAPRLTDWDGDGRPDLVALAGRRLVVWRQNDDAEFRYHAGFDLPDRRGALLSPSYSVELADVDGDRRADVVLVSGQTRDDDVTSQVEVFLQAGGTGFDRSPDDKLRLQGFVDVPRFDDVDGDGRGDLAIGSLRPDLIGTLSGGGDDVEAQLNLFLNRFVGDRPRYRRPVALVHRVRIPGDLDDGWSVLARFVHDVDDDGRRDLLLRTARDEVEIRRTTERGRGLDAGDVLWRLAIAEDAPARCVEGEGVAVLLVLEPTQVVHVELR